MCRSHQNVTNVGGDDFDEDDFLRRLRLVTSRVLVADASPSGGGRGQLRRSPFPSLMRLRHPGVKLEHKGHIYFTIVDFFIIQNGCYCTTVLLYCSTQSRKFTMTEMAISTPTYYTLKYLGGITHVPVLRCTNYIQVVYFFWWFRTILST